MNSRDRVMATLNHIEPDKVPIDLGDYVTVKICKYLFVNNY